MALMNMTGPRQQLQDEGFAIIPGVLSPETVRSLLQHIDAAPRHSAQFRQEKEVFAIRNFAQAVPGILPLLFDAGFNRFVDALLGKEYFLVKSIYFDKPGDANWLVPWHQDLTISVDRKVSIEGFGPWTIKEGVTSVQPPAAVLENIYTIRLHLDDCDETNGALKIARGSHKAGKRAASEVVSYTRDEVVCAVPAGGAMIMQPLLLHASGRRTSRRNRRVIHLEFASRPLPCGLQWHEYIDRNRFF